MYRTHNCGALRIEHVGQKVTLSGWLNKNRDYGSMTFIDLRDRYGITQLVFNTQTDEELYNDAKKLGREYVLCIEGVVAERSNKNPKIPTGDIEILVEKLSVLNESLTPPFTIEEETDGGEEIRMKYRYLDLRRRPVQENLFFRSKVAIETRKYLSDNGFIEVETPVLIKSTPEGARDFVVPSRMNKGQFYALPQSPQTFKQLLMVSGFDKYFQLVKCFRDEDLRADRQPEFTQIDCEMSFVTQEEILQTFEGLTRYLFKECLGVDLPTFPRMTYDEALKRYGSDKPDTRFGMEFVELNDVAKGHGFPVFDGAELVVGICATGQADQYSNKDIKKLTSWMQRPQIGAKGLVYVKYNLDGSVKSSVGKFYTDEQLMTWIEKAGAQKGDMLLILSGETDKVRDQLNALRLEMGDRMGLRSGGFNPLWVVDFPLLEWDEDSERFHAMHHPFTSPKKADIERMLNGDHDTMKALRADAYDLVINGWEIGGGSIRIFDRELQAKNFKLLGFTEEEAEEQFGFLMGAFEYGAPPHGGIAFGFDRLCSIMKGAGSIRDFIAFPKNNQGRDVMINGPETISKSQFDELGIQTIKTVICDTNIWYSNRQDLLSKISQGCQLKAVYTNLEELTTSPNLVKTPIIVKEAIQRVMGYHHKLIIDNPLIHILKLDNPKYDNSKYIDKYKGLMNITNRIANSEIDINHPNNKSIFNDVSVEAKNEIRSLTNYLNEYKEQVRIFLKKEFKTTPYNKKTHRKKDTTELTQDFIRDFIKRETGDTLSSTFDWSQVELLVSVIDAFFKDLELSNRKVEPNDLHDIFILSYVQPGCFYWTKENKWNKYIEDTGMKKYIL